MFLQDDQASGASSPGSDATSDLGDKAQSLWGAFTDGDISGADLGLLWETLGWPLAKAVILILVMLFVASWARKIIGGAARKAHVEETLARFFGQIARWAIIVLGVLAILQTFGIETTSFAAVIAATGFAIGMALSGMLGNFASGIMLLIFRPFKVGDFIRAGGVSGTVDTIDLFMTTFHTSDNRRLIVPNSAIWDGNIENVTFHETRRVDVKVGTTYEADIDKTREVLIEAARNVEGRWVEKDPVAYLDELGGSSLDWTVKIWSPTSEYWEVKERLTQDVKVALDKAGIGIPYPQMDVHMRRVDQPGGPG